MKSSKNKKSEVDDISRETQRLVSDSHVHLPYHKPKQKSLKDFLNRQKISKECQVSITGSKKLLQKAWELIESKEKTVEKFYNEDCCQDENNVELSSSGDNIQNEKNTSVDNDNNSDSDEDLILDEEHKNTSEYCDDENNSIAESEISATNVSPLIDDIDHNSDVDDDDDEVDEENLEHKFNYNNFENHDNSSNDENELKKNVAKQFIDDEAQSESDCSSENEANIPNFIDDSDDEEVLSLKKKRKIIALSDSDDENEIINDDSSNTDSKVITQGLYETDTNICTQQLMGLCSGQFQTQELEAEENDEDFEDDFDSDVPQNHSSCTNNYLDEMPKLTSVKDLFKNDEDDLDASQNNFESIENDDFDELAKITSVKDVFHDETDDSDNSENVEKNRNYSNEDMPKPTSAKDFFDEEAELSESDWSSDDEDHLMETIDKLEEEEGDQDKLDENIIKDGLDKIYMRQLLDDDQQQVTALKEMLLEDGDLHSDSTRKRKFQWDETDQNDSVFKKPLFSDNEDDEDADDVLSDDEKLGNWRKERFKRESFLSQQDDEEYDHSDEELSDNLQTSVSIVKKMHVVKYQKDNKKNSNNKCDENNELNCESIDSSEKNTSTSITVLTDTLEANKIKNSDLCELQVTNISSKFNKIVKGSFMKHTNNNKMTNTLLYINKKPIIGIDEKKNVNYEDKSEIKSMNTITAKASSNPFAYLLRNDNKQEITNAIKNEDKKENVSYISKSVQSTSVESTQNIHQTKIRKPVNSILKQLE